MREWHAAVRPPEGEEPASGGPVSGGGIRRAVQVGHRRVRGQLASAAVIVSSRTATTSIRAGEPSTDPQLSGRGGREAP
ncbi:hypothetical protein GCM10022233_05460 [Streptomyces shaanxiensis]|uniref:Uncharacterized protein n=1 Tax=Streptomyces shaanxiensis TaxID=653357 RepID=A0ABP7UBP8_9ACTN